MKSPSEKLRHASAVLKQALLAGHGELGNWRPLIGRVLLDPQPLALLQCAGDTTVLFLKEAAGTGLRREIFDAPLEVMTASDVKRLTTLCTNRALYLSVHSADVLHLQMRLPGKSAGNVHELAKYRLLTESPIAPENILFDARWNRMAATYDYPKQIIEVALCRRTVVERLQGQVNRHGLATIAIGYAQEGTVGLDFFFKYMEGRHAAASRLYGRILLALGPALISLFALFATWGYALWAEAALRQEVVSLSSRTEEAARILARRAHVVSVNKMLHDDISSVTVSELLNTLSQALPKSAWLTEIRMENGKLNLIGNGTDPTAAAKALAFVPGLAALRLESVTAIPASGVQRFEVDASIVAGKTN